MNEPRNIEGSLHRFDQVSISWAGLCAWNSAVAFGTEEGEFVAPVGDDIEAITVASEALNGAAFVGRCAAFSSRGSIVVVRQEAPTGAPVIPLLQQDRGAHGVVASAHGAFFFPAGPDGILVACPIPSREEFSSRLLQAEGAPIYAYHAARVGPKGFDDVIAFAARTDGVFVLIDQGNGQFVSGPSHRFNGRDIVAIAPVNDARFPLGAVALSDRGDMLLIPNVTEKEPLGALNYPQVRGCPYTVCAAKGHVFILTSKEVVVIPNGIAHLADPHAVVQQAWFLPVEATDMVSIDDERLLLIADGAAEEFLVDNLLGLANASSHANGRLTQFHRLSPRGILPSIETTAWQGLSSGLVVANAG